MSECANMLMRGLFMLMVEKVYSTYARWAKQYEKKRIVKRQKKQGQTMAGAGGQIEHQHRRILTYTAFLPVISSYASFTC